jgi:2-ketocyclohexanecarboxyl-CoA hydrolase
MALSPKGIGIAKRSFNADSNAIKSIDPFGMQVLKLFYATEESQEGVNYLLKMYT